MPPPPKSGHNPALDLVRATAAFLVFFCHLRGHFFVAWGDLDPSCRTTLNFCLFTLGRLGRESVMIFFALSGYLVGGKSLQAMLSGKLNASDYACSRLSRFYAIVPAALILTLICDYFRLGNFSLADARTFWCNLGMLQGIASPSFGSNAPLWSLAYEWWYYVFGLGALLGLRRFITKQGSTRLCVLGFVLAMVALFVMSRPMLEYFPVWLAGACLGLIKSPPTKTWPIVASGAILLGACALSMRRQDLLGDYSVGIGALVLIASLIHPRNLPQWMSKPIWFAAAISFSLYTIHYPLIELLQAAWNPIRVATITINAWTKLFAIGGVILLIVVVFWWIFERNTTKLKRWLQARWPQANP